MAGRNVDGEVGEGLRSAWFAVLIVPAPPDALLVAAQGSTVQPLIHAPKGVQAAGIGGVGMVDDAIGQCEGAHARPLAGVGGDIGSSGGRDLGDGPLVAARFPLLNRPPGQRLKARPWRWLAPIVVLDFPFTLLLAGKADAEVGVEVAVERGCPGECPGQAALVCLLWCGRSGTILKLIFTNSGGSAR